MALEEEGLRAGVVVAEVQQDALSMRWTPISPQQTTRLRPHRGNVRYPTARICNALNSTERMLSSSAP